MVNCPKCREPEFSLVGRMTACTISNGRYMVRRIAKKWVIRRVEVGPSFVEFRCHCGNQWKESVR